jgi:hypothetical protein
MCSLRPPVREDATFFKAADMLLVLNLCWYGLQLLGWITKKMAEPPLVSPTKTFPKWSSEFPSAEWPEVENLDKINYIFIDYYNFYIYFCGGAPAFLATKTLTTDLVSSPFT